MEKVLRGWKGIRKALARADTPCAQHDGGGQSKRGEGEVISVGVWATGGDHMGPTKPALLIHKYVIVNSRSSALSGKYIL